MTKDLILGIGGVGIGLLLFVLGLPRDGVSPRVLQFDAATVVYPPLIMIFLALGAANLLSVLL